MPKRSVYDNFENSRDGARLLDEHRALLDVSEMIHSLLKKRRVSTRQLAGVMGASEQSLESIIDGKATITVRTVAHVLHVLGYTLQVRAVRKKAKRAKTKP